MTSVMQFGVTVTALIIAASVVYYTVSTANSERNAALVSIGIAVLRSDPTKEPQVRGAREWALNLIDANAGGVKFSPSARSELLEKRLDYNFGFDYGDFGGAHVSPAKPLSTKLPSSRSD
jgi:hypothetical protein